MKVKGRGRDEEGRVFGRPPLTRGGKISGGEKAPGGHRCWQVTIGLPNNRKEEDRGKGRGARKKT